MERIRFIIIVSAHFFIIQNYIHAQGRLSDEIPFRIIPEDFKPLRSTINQEFESDLYNELSTNPEWKRLIRQKKMAIGLVDLRDLNHIKFGRINGNHMMYAASLPKIAILLAVEDALEKGELVETTEIRQDIADMISKSNNAASTRLMDLIGYEKIESVLKDPKYELYDEDFGGGLWVGKRYARTGKRNPDPLMGISHGATASQVCRFYYMLVFGKLVSFERSREMLNYMDDPALHHKFVNTLDAVAPKARLYRKSGSWQDYHSDSVLVIGPERRYILVAIVQDPEGESIIRNIVFSAEKVLNEKLK